MLDGKEVEFNAAAALAEKRALNFGEVSRAARWGWAGETKGPFERPLGYSGTPYENVYRHAFSRWSKVFSPACQWDLDRGL
jgi:hypothetical protein